MEGKARGKREARGKGEAREGGGQGRERPGGWVQGKKAIKISSLVSGK